MYQELIELKQQKNISANKKIYQVQQSLLKRLFFNTKK